MDAWAPRGSTRGERSSLTLPRTWAVLQRLAKLADARIPVGEKFVTCITPSSQFGDPGIKVHDRCGQLGDRTGVGTWRGIADRNSQRNPRRYARVFAKV